MARCRQVAAVGGDFHSFLRAWLHSPALEPDNLNRGLRRHRIAASPGFRLLPERIQWTSAGV